MALVNVDTDKLGKSLVENADRVLLPKLQPILDELADRLVDRIMERLTGKPITILIGDNNAQHNPNLDDRTDGLPTP